MMARLLSGLILASLVFSPADAFARDEESAPAAAPQIRYADWSELQTEVTRHHGRVVVVDIWSTACLPCIKELPGLKRLADEFPNDVHAMTFSVDYAGIKSRPPKYYEDRVVKMLSRVKVTDHAWMCTQPADELFAELKLLSIPAILVYDKNGKLLRRFDPQMLKDGDEEAFTYDEDIIPYVRSIISGN